MKTNTRILWIIVSIVATIGAGYLFLWMPRAQAQGVMPMMQMASDIPASGISWETIRDPLVMAALLALLMQFFLKNSIEAILCLVITGAFNATEEQFLSITDRIRTPIYFLTMWIVAYVLFRASGLEGWPSVVSAIVCSATASGTYETVKAVFKFGGSDVVPLGYKWH